MLKISFSESITRIDSWHHRDLTFTCDEGDEFADALLHAFLGLLCDFGIVRQSILHDARDWSKITDVSIELIKLIRLVSLGDARRFR